MTATIHLVCGSTGAGKTTFSVALASQERGLRVSIDEWMTTLFEPDQPSQIRFDWMIDRVNRCEDQMWALAQQAAKLGISVIVDCGLTRQIQRAKWAGWAAAESLPVRLHHLDIDVEERWRRVTARNVNRGPTYRLEVTREMFDFVETLWEPPSAEEMLMLNGNTDLPVV